MEKIERLSGTTFIPLSKRSLLAYLSQLINGFKMTMSNYVNSVSGVRARELSWPHSHADPDVWYNHLVCMDCGKGLIGDGDFVYALIDRILECKHGDVLIYNPQHFHGTARFHLHEGDEVF